MKWWSARGRLAAVWPRFFCFSCCFSIVFSLFIYFLISGLRYKKKATYSGHNCYLRKNRKYCRNWHNIWVNFMLVTTGNDFTANWVSCCVVTSESRGGKRGRGRDRRAGEVPSTPSIGDRTQLGPQNGKRERPFPPLWPAEIIADYLDKWGSHALIIEIQWFIFKRGDILGGKEEEKRRNMTKWFDGNCHWNRS